MVYCETWQYQTKILKGEKMARFCNAQKEKGQTCKNCQWYTLDVEELTERRYFCAAIPDYMGNVYWKPLEPKTN